ncbi:virulence factor mce family protein [Mycobacterium tuberculosis]|nr:virulence factor mce family protein [Mycobacterium tuberculosis]
MRAEMKSFAERNRLAIGTVGIVVVAAVALAALQYQRLPFFNQGTRVSAYFADAGGLRTGNTVEVSGYPVGKVSSISLDGPGVLVEFKVDTDVRLGNRTEVAIKTKGLLGSKFLDVTPRGDGRLDSPIPIERTTSPYQLPDALGDLAATISGLHTERLSESLATLAQTFADTPAHFRNATGWPGSPKPSMSATTNCAACWPTRPKPPGCWPTAPTRSSAWCATRMWSWRSCAPKAPPWTGSGRTSRRWPNNCGASSLRTASSCARRWTSSTGCWLSSKTAKSVCGRPSR